MGFIETLNKFGDKISIQKTDLYKHIENVKSSIEAKGLKVKIKNEFELFQYEIIYNGLLDVYKRQMVIKMGILIIKKEVNECKKDKL